MVRNDTDSARRDESLRRNIAELLSLPARHLGELPVETRIVAQHPGIKQDIVLLTGASPGAPGELTFDAEELRALAEGAEAERLWTWDFVGFCLMKQHDPRFRITREIALAGAQWVENGPAWPAEAVFLRLGLTVTGVALGASTPKPAAGVRAA